MKKGSKHKPETIEKIKAANTPEHKAKMKAGMLKFWDEVRELKKKA